MAKRRRIFISFAEQDETSRSFLVKQARTTESPFDFVAMSVKQPGDETWKANCRTKIKGCDGMIALVSRETAKADGALWEVKCAQEELGPSRIRGIYVDPYDKPSTLPSEFAGVGVVEWTWPHIKWFLDFL